MLTTEQMEELAALPDIARQALLDGGHGHPGWWIRWEGGCWTVKLYGCPSEGKESYTVHGGWSWAPCSESLWMKAATPPGWDWDTGTADGEPCARIFENLPGHADIFEDASAVDCALMTLRVRFCPINELTGKSGGEIAELFGDVIVVEAEIK